MKAKSTFQKEIAATQSASTAIYDMLAVLWGFDNHCLLETDKSAPGSRDVLERIYSLTVLCLGERKVVLSSTSLESKTMGKQLQNSREAGGSLHAELWPYPCQGS